MVNQTAMKLWMVILSALILFQGCVGYHSKNIGVTLGASATANGLFAHIDSMTCCMRLGGKIIEGEISIKNVGERPFVVSPYDISLVDADDYSVTAADSLLMTQRYLSQDPWWFKPQEIIDFERRFKERFVNEAVIATGSEIRLRVFFPERVDFDNLSAIRVRSSTGGMTVEIPLR